MTRRFLLATLPSLALGAVSFDAEMQDSFEKDTWVRIIDAAGDNKQDNGFLVAVRTTLPGLLSALVAVFYETEVMLTAGVGKPTKLYLHEESMAPVVGRDAYGATNKNFAIPRDKIRFIQVTFYKEVARREVGR